MPLLKTIQYKGSKICIFENTFSSNELFERLGNLETYIQDFEELKSEKRKKEFLGLRLGLQQCLNGELKEVVYTADGKPKLKDSSHFISFSHSRNWIAVMSHPEMEVGVDIEEPNDKFKNIYRKYMNERELEDFENKKDINQLRVIWSAKEVLFKIIGNEAINFADQLRVFPFESAESGQIKAEHIPTGRVYDLEYLLSPEFTLVYCIDNTGNHE